MKLKAINDVTFIQPSGYGSSYGCIKAGTVVNLAHEYENGEIVVDFGKQIVFTSKDYFITVPNK